MKMMMSVLVGILSLSTIAFAAGETSTAPVVASDRIEVAPGVFGISNADAFEYVCDIETKEGSEVVKVKGYFDTDFSEAPGYRFAIGFVGDVSVVGILAAEAPVVSVTRARCPGLCLKATIKSHEDGSLADLDFSEDQITKVITLTNTEAGVSTVLGTCKKNEVK